MSSEQITFRVDQVVAETLELRGAASKRKMSRNEYVRTLVHDALYDRQIKKLQDEVSELRKVVEDKLETFEVRQINSITLLLAKNACSDIIAASRPAGRSIP